MGEENKDIQKIGKASGLLSIIEVGLGSFLHNFKIPFSGQILSLNQGFILTRASHQIKHAKAPLYISSISSIIKSLSPMGKKLTPMLAISAQGFLFNLGTFVFGRNFLGHLIGMMLLSLWSFIQPMAIYFLIFGKDLIYMGEYYLKKMNKVFEITSDELLFVILSVIIVKVLCGWILVFLAHKLSHQSIENYHNWIKKHYKPKLDKKDKPAFIGALKDLFNPFFLFYLCLFFVYLFYSKSNLSSYIWLILRPIAIAYILFYLIRVFPIEKVTTLLKEGDFKESFKIALKFLKAD